MDVETEFYKFSTDLILVNAPSGGCRWLNRLLWLLPSCIHNWLWDKTGYRLVRMKNDTSGEVVALFWSCVYPMSEIVDVSAHIHAK